MTGGIANAVMRRQTPQSHSSRSANAPAPPGAARPSLAVLSVTACIPSDIAASGTQGGDG
jgi:hypothetical protein